MGVVFAVALGGAIGSALRFLLSKVVQEHFGISFPVGTLFVNLVGAFFIGFFFAYLVDKLAVNPHARALLITGLLGGLTTFSTYSYESFSLLREGETLKFLAYTLGTNVLGIFFTFLGYILGESL
ncbi:fluoride efflux transporter CrcB [Aquifex aeolicus]|uniref:Fluoride-specific ion channel FluC n=1 Tax=Aquifex aeolicus (strain VF5) TaxID=224324 RepID=FLUC_AQUAE|nr:fluoride efflux transporter CrcB [Aquifex aeolicus]O66757.1 RecName: Full=Fluoride-specific ion channel FluC [Aquifex aeolicus VF5]AAC06721.1 hypothetical protein aq_449 [Aquifex aeolicus VF5]